MSYKPPHKQTLIETEILGLKTQFDTYRVKKFPRLLSRQYLSSIQNSIFIESGDTIGFWYSLKIFYPFFPQAGISPFSSDSSIRYIKPLSVKLCPYLSIIPFSYVTGALTWPGKEYYASRDFIKRRFSHLCKILLRQGRRKYRKKTWEYCRGLKGLLKRLLRS